MTRALLTAITGIVIALYTAAVLALLLAAIRRAPETYPWGDTATTSIYTLRAARGELATGAYSRFHWNHPGPLLYQMLAPLYALSGRREISLKWTMLALNLGTLAWLLTTVRRRAPMLAATVALALAPLLYREQRLLFWAWNPIVPLLPLALTVALSAVVAAGSVVPLPLLCAVMSVIVQSHVGFAPVMFVLLTSAVALLAAHARRGEVSSTLTDVRRSVGLSAVVIAALWAVPIGHEIETWPGNLARMAQFFRAHAPERQASATVLGVWANQVIGPFAPAWELTTAAASERAP